MAKQNNDTPASRMRVADAAPTVVAFLVVICAQEADSEHILHK